MTIAFLINQTHKEENNFTTTLFAYEAHKRGHRVIYIGLADFVYIDDNKIEAHARILESSIQLKERDEVLNYLRNQQKTRIAIDDIDVLWLRFDPVIDMINRPWAPASGLQFAQLIKKLGRLVINDPDSLTQAGNKLYLENFDKSIRPKSLVTRSHDDIKVFLKEQNGKVILKPIKGSGGKNVFLITADEQRNLKQTVEVIGRDGYVIAQEYLPEATKGDLRFFLLDGKPIIIDGKYAAVQRVQQQGEIRSNLHQGATTQQGNITAETLDLVAKVSEKLLQDGMYFVGLDIVGDKIMEINVFSPGALAAASEVQKADFVSYIIDDIEKKVSHFYKK